MHDWYNFAKFGNPNGDVVANSGPELGFSPKSKFEFWYPWGNGNFTKTFVDESLQTKNDWRDIEEKCGFWDEMDVYLKY